MTRKDLVGEEVEEHFRFGPGEVHISKERFKIPIMSEDENGKDIKMIVNAFEVKADVPLLCGKNTLYEWGAQTNHRKNVVENKIVSFNLVQTRSGHDALGLIPVKEESLENTVSYITEQVRAEDESNIFDYKKVKKIHESTNHKMEANMLYAYRNAGVLTDEGRKVIKKVVANCRI